MTLHRGRRIRTAAAAVGIAAGLTLGAIPAAHGFDDASTTAACSWGPKKPYKWSSENTGYVRAKLHVDNDCSRNSKWVGKLKVYEWGSWVTRDKVEWRGRADQRLQYDCEDGTTTAYKAVMKNKRNGAKRVSAKVDITCPTP